MRLKQLDDALADVDTAVTLTPDSGEAYFFRGRLRLARCEFSQVYLAFLIPIEEVRKDGQCSAEES
jgi:hypothetical protein